MARVPYMPGNPHLIRSITGGGGPGDLDLVIIFGAISTLPASVTVSGTGSFYDGTWVATPYQADRFTIEASGVGGNVGAGGRWD